MSYSLRSQGGHGASMPPTRAKGWTPSVTSSIDVPDEASRSISALAFPISIANLVAVLAVALRFEALSPVKFYRRIGRQRIDAVAGIVEAVFLPGQIGQCQD